MERSGDVKTRLLGAREMCQRSVMSKLVAHGATLACSQGTAPSRLAVPPVTGIDDEAGPLATVQDVKPLVNIAPFGACRALANPQVALATAAALGVLTPQPCVPVTAAPWSPGSAVVRVDGTAIGRVGRWPHDPGRSHTHLGFTHVKGTERARQRILKVAAGPFRHYDAGEL